MSFFGSYCGIIAIGAGGELCVCKYAIFGEKEQILFKITQKHMKISSIRECGVEMKTDKKKIEIPTQNLSYAYTK